MSGTVAGADRIELNRLYWQWREGENAPSQMACISLPFGNSPQVTPERTAAITFVLPVEC